MARTLGTKRLKKAIRNNKRKNAEKQSFLIVYKKLNGRTVKRKVSPNDLKYGLLYGYDHKRKDLRSYRMDRMVSMKKVAFWNGFEKRAGWGHGFELAGLGTLAIPSVKTLRDPKATPKERSHAKFELGGLGILAAPSAVALGKKALGK